MKYYIYKYKGIEQDAAIFVFDTKKFATECYNPSTMAFTGFMIEAENVDIAKEIYNHPSTKLADEKDATISWCEEPEEVKKRRDEPYFIKLRALKDAVKKAELAAHALTASVAATQIALEFRKINKNLSDLARTIYLSNTKDSAVTERDIFNRLKEKYIEEFRGLGYPREQ